MLDFTNETTGGGSTASSSINTLFSVNSGNVNASGEGDLVGEANYTTVIQDNFYSLAGNDPIDRTDGIFKMGSSDVVFAPNSSIFDYSTLFSATKWRVTFRIKASGVQKFVLIQTLASNATKALEVYWYNEYSASSNKVSVYPSSGSSWSISFDHTPENFSNQYVYLSVMRDDSTIYIQQSLDNSTWDTLASVAVSSVTRSYSYFSWTATSNALVDMNNTYVEINDEVVWRGYASVNKISSLSFKIGGIYPSLTATNGQGTQFTIEELDSQDLSSTADGTYNIFLTPEGTTYALANTIYIQKSTPSMDTGDIWFNTSEYPYEVTKYGTEGNFEDIPICQITIATQSSGSKLITASKTYPYNRLSVIATELSNVAYSGSYNDLINKPTIPSYSVMTGADGSNAGTSGLVPAPAATDNTKFLRGDGSWGTPSGGSGSFSEADLSYQTGTEALTDTTLYNYIKTLYDAGTTEYRTNYTITGSPTITSAGVASGFTDNVNYVYVGTFDVTGKSFEVDYGAVTIPSSFPSGSLPEYLCTSSLPSSRFGLGLSVSQNKIFVTVGGAVEGHGSAVYGSEITAGETYYIKCGVDTVQNKAYIKTSTDGTNYTTYYGESTLTTPFTEVEFAIGTVYNDTNATVWQGSYNLNNLSFSIEDVKVWQGYYFPCKKLATGSRVADVANLSKIQAIKNVEGSALYYVIDTTNQTVRLPMGDIFGFITQAMEQPSA